MATPTYPLIQPSIPRLEDIVDELSAVLSNPIVTTGPKTREFEASVCELLRVEHTVAVSSCTSGLALTLRALELRGEVIIPAFTFTATGLAAVWAGLTPVFCDCREDTLTLDPESVAAAIGDDTVAMMPVPVFGVPCDNEELLALAEQRGLRVVFDSAQALGSIYRARPLGSFGSAEVFSLSPTKVISAVEGGLVTTNDAQLAERIRRLRDYGKSPDGRDFTDLGLSARFSELHAVIGRHNIARARDLIGARQSRIARFRAALSGTPGLRFVDAPDDRESSGIYMVVRVAADVAGCSRDELSERLAARGCQSRAYFTPPLHQQAVYAEIPHRCAPSLANSERAAKECLAIPLYANMLDSEVDEVASMVRDALSNG